MVASLTMSQAPCAWPNERDSKPINNNYQKRASSRRKNINKATQSKAKNNKNNRATKDESDSGVRVGCPYYIKDPNKHHNTLSCRGAGFKEVAKLRDHLKDVHNISPTLQSELNFKQRKFLALKTIKEKWNLAFRIIFPEVPKDEIPDCVNTTTVVTAAVQQVGEEVLKSDEYVKVGDLRKMIYEMIWKLYKNKGTIHISDFMRDFERVFEQAVQGARGCEEVPIKSISDLMDLDVKPDTHDSESDEDCKAYDLLSDLSCYNNYEEANCYSVPANVPETCPETKNNIMTSFCNAQDDAIAGALEMHGLPLDTNYYNTYEGINWHNEPFESQASFNMSIEYPSSAGYTPTYIDTDAKLSSFEDININIISYEGSQIDSNGA